MLQWYLAFVLAGSAVAQIPAIGKCPRVETMPNFDPEKYLGKWYEQARYLAFFEIGGKCVTATYGLNDNGTVRILNKQLSRNGSPSSIEGYAYSRTEDKSKLTVVFPSLPVKIEAPYWIVDTDYVSYALVYSCYDINIANAKNAWILTRERNPPMSVWEKAYEAADKNKISKRLFNKTDQMSCPADY